MVKNYVTLLVFNVIALKNDIVLGCNYNFITIAITTVPSWGLKQLRHWIGFLFFFFKSETSQVSFKFPKEIDCFSAREYKFQQEHLDESAAC